MKAEIGRRSKRPTYPSAGRQWSGLLATGLTIACLEAISRNGHKLNSPASILLLAILVVTGWSGLRAGMISTAASFVYLTILYVVPGTLHRYTPQIGRSMVWAAFVFVVLVQLVGLVQRKLRNAGIREFEAREAADAEAVQRLETEGNLRSSEELRRLVVDSATDAIVVTDEAGIITLWNPQADTIFGWASEEIVGKRIGDTVFGGAEGYSETDGLLQFVEQGPSRLIDRRVELVGQTKDARKVPIELTVVPYRADEETLCIAFIRDLTEQRKITERLRQAQKMEAIGTLAAGIAHDFNNILAALSGNLAIARTDIPTDHVAQVSLAEAERATSRATEVVRQILTFSSSQGGESGVIDVAASLQEALQLLRATIPATMEIEAHYEPGLPPIEADNADIHQIVLNLGINAHAALEGRTGKLEVTANSLTLDDETARALLSIEPGPCVRISFGDTGCGMDQRTLRRVFEPFFTTKPQGEGTGLGLSVVFGIVERRRGAINIYSEPGKGTVFHLYFPVAAPKSAVIETAAPAKDSRGHGERILYVDDDEALVFMMTRMLRRLNYEVSGFQQPREALEAFRANPEAYDLVITDISMPHIDGPSLVAELQTIRPDLPIIMVTGYIRPNDMEQASKLGIRELLLKPNTVHEMGETLHRVLTELRVAKSPRR